MGFWKKFDLHCKIHGLDPGEQGSRKRQRALNHFEHGYFFDYEDCGEIAERLNGEVGRGGVIACPAPGAPPSDRSLILKIDPTRPHEFYVYACPADLMEEADAYVRQRLELPKEEPQELVAERIARAMEVWNAAREPCGTIVETYLRSRKLPLPTLPVVRFHPDVYHADLRARFPAMVALMTDVEDQPTGIHLTFLARDGSGKAPIEKDQQRRTKGLIKGSAMRLTSGEGRLLIGEGIETTLSVYVGTGRPAWAVGGAKNLAACSLPPDISEITLLVDGDDQGRISAADAASIWRREGRSVILAEAPEGKDFNDLLMEGE